MGWYEEEKIATEVKWAREDISSELRDLRETQIRANQQANRRPSEPLPPEVKKKVHKGLLISFIVLVVLGILSKIVFFIFGLLYTYYLV